MYIYICIHLSKFKRYALRGGVPVGTLPESNELHDIAYIYCMILHDIAYIPLSLLAGKNTPTATTSYGLTCINVKNLV